jgi:O-antigen/teichoic acid export membrane protein
MWLRLRSQVAKYIREDKILNTAQKIAKNLFSLATAQIISQLLGFIAVAYLARVLGAEGFGKLGFATAILAYFMLLVNLGLDAFGIREVARNKDAINRYVNNTLTIKLVASIFAFVLLLILVYFIPKPLEIKKLILFLGFTLFTSAFLIDWLFQGIEKMEFVGIFRITKQICYVGVIFWIVKSPEHLLRIPFIQVGAGLVGIGFLFSIYARNFGHIKLDFDFSFWKHILRQSLPMGFSFMMIRIYYNIDFVMLGFMKDEDVVGWYSAAYKIILLILGFGGIYITAIFPIVSRYYKNSLQKLQSVLAHSAKLMLIVGLPLGIGGTVLAKPIMNQVYGTQYNNGIIAFQILIWGVVIIFISMVYGNSLVACNAQKKYMIGVTLGAITNIGLNVLLIPKFSLVGASIATVMAELTVFSYMYLNFQRIAEVHFIRYVWKPLAAALIMAGVLLRWQNHNVLLLIASGVLIYSIFILLLRGIVLDEIVMLKNQLLKKT